MKHCTECHIRISREEYEIFNRVCADCKADQMAESLELERENY